MKMMGTKNETRDDGECWGECSVGFTIILHAEREGLKNQMKSERKREDGDQPSILDFLLFLHVSSHP